MKFKIWLLKRIVRGKEIETARFETNTLKWQSIVRRIQYRIDARADVMNVFSCMRSLLAKEKLNFKGTHTDPTSEANTSKQYMLIHSMVYNVCLFVSVYAVNIRNERFDK